MTASTEAASDSDTDSSSDISGKTTADQPSTDDTGSSAAPGHDAGVGPGSLAFTSFLLALLCFSPFYMLGSNLWDLINGRGLLMEFTDSDPALERHLSFGHTTVEMINGYSVSYGTVHGMSGSARLFIGLLIAIHLLLIAACAVAFVRFIAAIRPGRPGFVDLLFTRGEHLFWLLLGQVLSSWALLMIGTTFSSQHFTRGASDTLTLDGTIPTGIDLPILKGTIILILATHLLLALHRLYQRTSALAAENTVLREETEGLV